MQREIVKRSSAVRTAAVWVTPTIEVWFHILRNGSELSDGNVPAEWLTAQIGVLNAAFAGVFAFTLAGVTDTVSSEWNVLGVYTQQEFDAKAALRRGTWSTLNIYIAELEYGLLGWAYFPVAGKEQAKVSNLRRDGVVLKYSSLPTGSDFGAPFNLGDTATHEVGHWLSLLHTFDGGCAMTSSLQAGDRVADTPAEAYEDYACDIGRNTCSGARFPGLDPVTNFMDYGDDACIDHFTPGQFERMKMAWTNMRANK